jgi:hypothetical protein
MRSGQNDSLATGLRGLGKVRQLVGDLSLGLAPAQPPGGRFDFLSSFPMGHVGMTAFTALTAFDFLRANIAHIKPYARIYWPDFLVPMRFTKPALMSGRNKSMAP